MSTKPKFKNKYENYSEKKGTVNNEPSVTDKSLAQDVDIYACIEKYGIGTLMRKTQANEYLYADTTTKPKNLHEALQQRKQLDEYFKQQPASVRKQFGDSAEEFIYKFQNGDFNEMISTGILSEELAQRYMEEMTNEQTATKPLEETNSTTENLPSDTNQGNN